MCCPPRYNVFFFGQLDNVTLHLDGVIYMKVEDPYEVSCNPHVPHTSGDSADATSPRAFLPADPRAGQQLRSRTDGRERVGTRFGFVLRWRRLLAVF